MALRRTEFDAGLVCAGLALGACVMAPPATAGSDIDEEVARRVGATARTRSDLLRELGVPAAIFARGRAEPLPGIPNWGTGSPGAHFATVQDGDPAFEVFAGRRSPGADDRVYYWFHSRSTKRSFVAAVVVDEKSDVEIDRLWALVDARTDAVRGVVFRAHR